MEEILGALALAGTAAAPIGIIVAFSNLIKGWIPKAWKKEDNYLPIIPLVVGVLYQGFYGGDGFSISAIGIGLKEGALAIGTFVSGKKLAHHSKWEASTVESGTESEPALPAPPPAAAPPTGS